MYKYMLYFISLPTFSLLTFVSYVHAVVPGLTILHISCTKKMFVYIYSVFECERGDLSFYEVCNFSYSSIYKRPDDGFQLYPKHVAVNKLVKSGVVCD
jgi:hypothetical protein